MRLILLILMICGVGIVTQSIIQRAGVAALWSDLKAFESKVAEENGERILALGGESDSESFDALLAKLWAFRIQTWNMVLGIAVIVLFALGIGLEILRTQRYTERSRNS